jgi:hypothetical protein
MGNINWLTLGTGVGPFSTPEIMSEFRNMPGIFDQLKNA